jgi:hypothetical protein
VKLNAYCRYGDAQEAQAGAEGIEGTTGCGYSNTREGVMVRRMGVTHGNCND